MKDPHNHDLLQSLCRYHHMWKTAKESAAARAEQRKKLRHPAPYAKHPGLK